jgi:hypothetical protein
MFFNPLSLVPHQGFENLKSNIYILVFTQGFVIISFKLTIWIE